MTTLASILTTKLAVIQTGTATTGSSNSFFTFVQVGFGCLVVFLVLFWLSLVIWTVRDIRARTQERVPRILAPVVVAVFFLGGLLIYRLLRPRHRQAELSAQELEETILLAEMATLQVCPRCQTRVEFDFIVCPCCHQELKRPCPRCVRLLELGWICCPYCALQLGAGSMPPGVPGTLAAQGAPGHVGVGAHAISGRRNEESVTGEGETGDE